MPACLTGRKDRESTFHHGGSPVKLVQDSFSERNDLQIIFLHCGGTVKLVQAGLSGRKDRTKHFTPLWRDCEANAGPFMCQK